MSRIVAKLHHVFLGAAGIAVGLMLTSATPGLADSGPFAGLDGSWSGGGTIRGSADAPAERIRCKGNYTVGGDGTTLQQTLRCASDSYRFDLTSNVRASGNQLSGSWQEASRNINGGITGSVSNGYVTASVEASGFAATLTMNLKSPQSISLNSKSSQLQGVQISMSRGR